MRIRLSLKVAAVLLLLAMLSAMPAFSRIMYMPTTAISLFLTGGGVQLTGGGVNLTK